ncbi:hypothetical protein G3576_00045 [Roseomonas stagni]|uniref:Uncharacterized protein n=1 Tax=Falsiroseomonas algicola TaxID=2716930 RepID=A0A6M1LDR2_9PROT|nr:hypothetical protein [Falsiroseomonas algicola]NGM18386.1 hypothetical protein [Falsiroseomonas algicola]
MGVAASLLGIVIWALHFGLVYGGQALACEVGRPSIVMPLVIGASVVALALLLVLAVVARRSRGGFLGGLAVGIAAFSALAVVWEAAPVLALPAC